MNFPPTLHKKLLLLIAFILLVGVGININAQDVLPRQATAEKPLKGSDSLSLKEPKATPSKSVHYTYEKNDLYDSWDNGNVYADTKKKLPDTYSIDLRGFAMPTPNRNVTSRYGYRAAFRRNHYGLDIKVYTGDTIVSAWDGKVRIVKTDPRGWGKYVVIRHPNGLETLYAHLSQQLVEVNQVVKAGEPIGLGGNTGRSTGSHLHLECRLLGEAINPELLFDFPNQRMTTDVYEWCNTNAKRAKNGEVSAEAIEKVEAESAALAEATGVQTPQPVSQPAKTTRTHKVKKGETAYKIAKKYGISVDKLLKNNGLRHNSTLRPGQILKI